jgi:glycosyltransferase involved in cell wall biosynthesis
MLAILTTHPIQYQVPLWQALAKDGRVPFEVWYLSDHGTRQTFDTQFKKSFAWDLDMLAGYPSRFLRVNKNHDVSRFGQLRLAESVGDLLESRNAKALWIQGWQVMAYWQAVWQAHRRGVPVWLRGESNDLAPIARGNIIKRQVLGRLFSKVSEFLYIGEANRRFYRQHGVREERLHPAYYCVDNERFKRQAEALRPKREQIRREWGIPADSYCILFAGKFIPKKRPLDVVQAVSNLTASGRVNDIHLLFAGSGDLGGELRRTCKVVYDAEADRFPLNGHSAPGNPPASFTGFLNQTEISRAYIAADCLMLPSDHGETWGLVVNEAMASSLPCIASDKCGCAEDLVAPIHADLRFPLGDMNAVNSALTRLLDQGVESSRLRGQIQKFDLSISVETVVKLYRDTSAAA